jgi:hypothetical protein
VSQLITVWRVAVEVSITADSTIAGDVIRLEQVRTGNGPQVWSAITNLVITLFRIHGVTSYTAETRRCARNPRRAL